MSCITIRGADLSDSIAAALQYISYTHPPEFIRYLSGAWQREQSEPARYAMEQILNSSRMSLLGQRPICQDTGIVNVFLKVGMCVRFDSERSLQELIDEGVRRAYMDEHNPLRASVVSDPLFGRTNTGDNTPAVVYTELVAGETVEVIVAAKGAGSENKARVAVLLPNDNVADWVVRNVAELGAGWCPPGILGIGVGGTVEKSALMAKQALMEPLDMLELQERGPQSDIERLRLEIYERVNALGIGAQGLGGMSTVLDVKIKCFATHAASLPVAVIPNCAATRHVEFQLDGTGPASFTAPDESHWPPMIVSRSTEMPHRVDLDALTREEVRGWTAGQRLLLTGRLLTARDAAHKRLADGFMQGRPPPVPLEGRVIYYTGPVDAVRDEIIGPAGPTTANRMDPFLGMMLTQGGILAAIGKGERGLAAIETIRSHGAASLVAVGGAAYLISKAIKAARVVGFSELGMEAIREFEVQDMPVIVAVDPQGRSIHQEGPERWRVIFRSPRSGTG